MEAQPGALAAAARAVLAQDGRGLALRPWQVAYLVALTEGREGQVPPGCGVGAGWLHTRLDEAILAEATGDSASSNVASRDAASSHVASRDLGSSDVASRDKGAVEAT
jgi:hypothetical protein